MTAEVCLVIDYIPGPFETAVSIPLEIKEIIPKKKPKFYDYYYYYGDYKRQADRRVRSVGNGMDSDYKSFYPAARESIFRCYHSVLVLYYNKQIKGCGV